MFPEIDEFADIDEAQWPADLRRLADQLHGEAESLAECYPAERGSQSLSPVAEPTARAITARQRNWLRWLLGTSVAAALLLSLAWAGSPWPLESDHRGADGRSTAGGSAEIASPEPRAPEWSDAAEPMPFYPVGIRLPGQQQPSTPALSAPEWEAVLDLTPAEKWEGVELSL